MEAIAADLDESRARQLARHYSELPPGSSPDAGWDGAAARRGARIAERGVPETRVPSCVDCHGPDAGERNPAYPVLAGQHAAYLILQLELFQAEARGGSPWAGLMRPSVHRLTPQQTRDVAHYYASLGG
jgi:cytochrome c553